MSNEKKAGKKVDRDAKAEPDALAAYEEHKVAALALPDEAIVPYRLDPDLAVSNVGTAMKVVLAHRNEIPKHLPLLNLGELTSLPSLALASKYAALKAEETVPSEKIKSEKLAEARDLRSLLMPVARGLAAAGLVSQQKVDDIERGRGPRDTAGDCVALGELFRHNKKALHGKHPVSDEKIEKAIAVGSWLLENLKPAHAPAEKAAPPSPAVVLRNRFASLLSKRYAALEVVAHYFHGPDYESLVPPLNSRRASAARETGALPEVDTKDTSGDDGSKKPE